MNQFIRVRLVLALFLCVISPPILAVAQPKHAPQFKQVVSEAEEACAALVAFNKENEPGAFDFKSITTYGKLADAYMITNQLDKAKEILSPSLPAADVDRLVTTSAVKFGAPIPQIPESLEESKQQIWKLEIFISLAHGWRHDEAVKVLNTFSQSYQAPARKLRYLKIIADNCIKEKNQAKAKPIASQIWKQLQKLDDKEQQTKLEFSLYLLELAQDLKLKESAKKLFPYVQNQFVDLARSSNQNIEPDTLLRMFRRQGLACARQGNHDAAQAHLKSALATVELIQSDLFGKESSYAEVHIAYADAFRMAGNKKESLSHTLKAIDWLKKVEVDREKSVANSIDGGTGFFSAVFGLGQYSEHKNVVIAQAKIEEHELAERTWKSIPFCIQKIQCQIELANYFRDSGSPDQLQKCVDRCLELAKTVNEFTDIVACKVAAAFILHKSGQGDRRDKLLRTLVDEVTRSKSDLAKQNLANDLVAMDLLEQSYLVIQSIKSNHNRALPLAGMAKEMAEAQARDLRQ